MFLIAWAASTVRAADAFGQISGRVTDPQGATVPHARIRVVDASNAKVCQTATDLQGYFLCSAIGPGEFSITATALAFDPVSTTVRLEAGRHVEVNLQFRELAAQNQAITVSADVTQVDVLSPDPAEKVFSSEDLMDANPGRPGAPISIPGYPIETASSGIKAPQYFAPGVAGDHGEPIAQFIQVGSYLVPNNLSANAHGNGYSDPNIFIANVIDSVEVDGGAFNVREGNHALNLATTYSLRSHLDSFFTLTGDQRDVTATAGLSPSRYSWIAMEFSYGNGFLDRLEHRKQVKFNGGRVFYRGDHTLTLFGIGYYGFSYVAGLRPMYGFNSVDAADGWTEYPDTVDPRQKDQTHTALVGLNDVWRLGDTQELQVSGFFRTYNLSLFSDFGVGLIRQSEFRTVTGGSTNYTHPVNQYLAILIGVDDQRDAPRRLDLDHYESGNLATYGPFEKVTANNVTLDDLAPYVALDGKITSWLHYDAGWRRDEIGIGNTDLLYPVNSYAKWIGVNSPKSTLSLTAPERLPLPSVSFSFGQTFFTNDPRIGTGTTQGTPVSRAHAYQIVAHKAIGDTDFRVTLGRITQEQSLAKIDPDTGLQFDEGPSRNRYVTAAARHFFRGGFLQASVSKADARDLSSGEPLPEAPRLIADVLGTLDRLPLGLRARAEFETVGRKPLGDGFVSVPVREFRGALARQFGSRLETGINFLFASGFTGQTTEVLALPDEPSPFERVVGVRVPCSVALSLSYRFGRGPR